MSITVGQKLGPYEIIAPAGAGGMGEVYKAKDTRLERTVAIKVLPSPVSGNDELRARFEREAKAISSLNHPHICTLHDVGHQDGTDYLVLEYIEGETLSERLKKGPLGIDELLRFATQIADALDKAHRQGLVHRDLKPGNVMITREGAKLLDFGLAKLQASSSSSEAMREITQTTPLTGTGTLLGTIQYMSPEQLEGQEADSRSDIFAFGLILYEMVTGIKAFEGKSQASLIAAVLEREPRPISEIKPMVPPALERVVRKCLAKDREDRWQSARDMGDELRWIHRSGSQAGTPAPVIARRRFRFRLAWAIAAVASVAAITIGAVYFLQPAQVNKISRFILNPPAATSAQTWPRISPDGKMVAFLAADSSGVTKIWVRPLSSLDANPLPGTEQATRPWWSPDSRYLAFFVGNQLKKIPVQGGPAQLICEAKGGYDGSWGSSGIILFDGNRTDSIRQVSAAGGVPGAATKLNKELGQKFHAWPFFLPDGKHFLYLAGGDSASAASRDYQLSVASLDGGTSKALFRVASRVEYSPAGYILHSREGILFAHPFDASKLEVTGEPIPIAQNVAGGETSNFSVSADGTVSYQIGASGELSELVWLDRSGKQLGKIDRPSYYRDIRLSPDGARLAYQYEDPSRNQDDIWVHDLKRGVSSRLTFDEANEVWPVWSPDGTRIYYASNADNVFTIYERQANGLGEARRLCKPGKGNLGAIDISRDGRTIFGVELSDSWNIVTLAVGDSAEPTPIIATSYHETRPQLSPNGRFIVYQSNESGRPEVYVRELSAGGGKWQVSADNGFAPRWRADGKELFYLNGAMDMIAVPVTTEGSSFEAGLPNKLFNQVLNFAGITQYRYDVTSDGQRFLLNIPLSSSSGVISQIVIVQNWPEELKQR